MNELIEKKGCLREIIFHNEDNSYTVAVMETEGEEFTLTGNIYKASKGRQFCIRGYWTTHKNYGEQFVVVEYEEEMPSSTKDIENFLASGLIRGIGPKTAKSIVALFSENSLDIIKNTPHMLKKVDGIGEAKVAIISKSFAEHREIAEISLYLQKYSIESADTLKIYKVFKGDTIKIIQENPYKLVDEIFGIGFRKADIIAAKMGVESDSPFRIKAAVTYTLTSLANDGHTFYPKGELCEKTAKFIDVPVDMVKDELFNLAVSGEIVLENIENRDVVYLPFFAYAEKNVAKSIHILNNVQKKAIQADFEGLMKKVESENSMKLAEQQKKAAREAFQNGVFVLTGGPGTGKTTTINTIIRVFDKCSLEIAIAAPTGRAAKRITETSGYEAKTIHRLLEYSFYENENQMRFGKNAENPLKHDVVIIDEASMIDITLMNALVSAISPSSRLILVGDADQLPSISAGNVLRDILSSETVSVIKLSEIFRQAKESMIVVNAHKINKGEYPKCNSRDTDFFLLRKIGETKILETIKDLCQNRLKDYYREITDSDIQIITPTRKNLLGSINLNKEMQEILNPMGPNIKEKKIGEKILRVGDKVMQNKNNYTREWQNIEDFQTGEGVFNGDLGTIHSIDNENNVLSVLYDDKKLVKYDFMQLEEVELAYAVTVHKSQGSEFPVVVMPLFKFHNMLANRNLFYTAITRAKKAVVLIGSEDVIIGMIDNNLIKERFSGLSLRMQNIASQV